MELVNNFVVWIAAPKKPNNTCVLHDVGAALGGEGTQDHCPSSCKQPMSWFGHPLWPLLTANLPETSWQFEHSNEA